MEILQPDDKNLAGTVVDLMGKLSLNKLESLVQNHGALAKATEQMKATAQTMTKLENGN